MITDEEKQLCGLEGMGGYSPSASIHKRRPNWIDLSLNYNCLPSEKKEAIIVTAWHAQLLFLKATLANYRKTGALVVCSYDNPFKSWNINTDEGPEFLPAPDIFILPHIWTFKHITYDDAKRSGWFWDVVYGAGAISSFKNLEYIFTVNGDCIWEEPEGMQELIRVLGDGDFMSVSRERVTIHTCAVVYRAGAFRKIIEYLTSNYAVSTLSFHSPEILLGEAVRVLGLKETVAPEQPMEPDMDSVDHYSRYNQMSTWKRIVGYRNLMAECLTVAIERGEPVEKKYFDPRYYKYLSTGGQQALREYYETGDRRYILQLHDRSEDSWYDRLHYPLEHYGEEPILEKEK